MNDILDDVNQLAGNISPASVILLLAITIVAAVLLIFLCNGGLREAKKIFHRPFFGND